MCRSSMAGIMRRQGRCSFRHLWPRRLPRIEWELLRWDGPAVARCAAGAAEVGLPHMQRHQPLQRLSLQGAGVRGCFHAEERRPGGGRGGRGQCLAAGRLAGYAAPGCCTLGLAWFPGLLGCGWLVPGWHAARLLHAARNSFLLLPMAPLPASGLDPATHNSCLSPCRRRRGGPRRGAGGGRGGGGGSLAAAALHRHVCAGKERQPAGGVKGSRVPEQPCRPAPPWIAMLQLLAGGSCIERRSDGMEEVLLAG